MISPLPAGFTWPESWRLLTLADDLDALKAELRREVCPAHPLHNVTCSPFARSLAGDDVLYLTDHPQMPIAVVHLTWTKETSEPFPWCTGYHSWEDFALKYAKND